MCLSQPPPPPYVRVHNSTCECNGHMLAGTGVLDRLQAHPLASCYSIVFQIMVFQIMLVNSAQQGVHV